MASTLARILMWAGLAGEDPSGNSRKIAVDDNGQVKVSMSSDIQIGGVEIKNATDDTRAKVGAGNAAAVADNALAVADANVKAAIVALQAALKGAGNKDLSTVQTQIDAVTSAITALQSALKGASNKDLTTVETAIALLRTTLVGASTKDLTTLQAAVAAIQGTGTDTLTTLKTAILGASTKDLSTLDALLTILVSAINQVNSTGKVEVLSEVPPIPNRQAITALTAPGYSDVIDTSDNIYHNMLLVISGHATGETVSVRVLVADDAHTGAAPVAPAGMADVNADPATALGVVPIVISGLVTGTARNFMLSWTGKYNWACLHFISETGTGALTITPTYLGGR